MRGTAPPLWHSIQPPSRGCEVALARGPTSHGAHDCGPDRIVRSPIKHAGAVALGEALKNHSTVHTLLCACAEPLWFPPHPTPRLLFQSVPYRHGEQADGCSHEGAEESHFALLALVRLGAHGRSQAELTRTTLCLARGVRILLGWDQIRLEMMGQWQSQRQRRQ